MALSKVRICNVALSLLGEDAIRSFDENNKRARMCDVFFDLERDLILAKFDWPFARKLASLQPVDMTASGLLTPEGMYGYRLPNDCLMARDLYPIGTREEWMVMGSVLYCLTDPDTIDSTDENTLVRLYYTATATDPTKFSPTFAMLLSTGMAVKMCPALTQDPKLAAELMNQYRVQEIEAWGTDANIGTLYKYPDNEPSNDSFVNPDAFVSTET